MILYIPLLHCPSVPLTILLLCPSLSAFSPFKLFLSLSFIHPLQELLAEVNHKNVKNTVCQKLWRLMVHGLAWAICIASTTACVLGIYYFSDYMHQVRQVVSGSKVSIR